VVLDRSRRRFVTSAGALSTSAWLKLTTPAIAAVATTACDARDTVGSFVSLSAAQAKEFSAIAARIIPTTDTPGATEAGVIHFIDQSLADEMSEQRQAALSGLAEFLTELRTEHPDRVFSELDDSEQDTYLSLLEGSDFFEFMRLMTVYGFFAMSSHGGNRDHLSWSLIGFAGHGAWSAPFGHYDAETTQ
jgi:gluconate 2-dehydrogenase gamma chain